MTTHHRLTDPELQAEIRGLRHEQHGFVGRHLWFRCPLCLEHWHAIAYQEGVRQHRQTPVQTWGHVSGSTLEDLTLSPSYLAHPSRSHPCLLHLFVRNGVLQVLGDSRRGEEG